MTVEHPGSRRVLARREAPRGNTGAEGMTRESLSGAKADVVTAAPRTPAERHVITNEELDRRYGSKGSTDSQKGFLGSLLASAKELDFSPSSSIGQYVSHGDYFGSSVLQSDAALDKIQNGLLTVSVGAASIATGGVAGAYAAGAGVGYYGTASVGSVAGGAMLRYGLAALPSNNPTIRSALTAAFDPKAIAWDATAGIVLGGVAKAASALGVYNASRGAASVVAEGAAARQNFMQRQQRLLDRDVGYNLTPEETFLKYPAVGRGGTFVTDAEAFSSLGQVGGSQRFTVGVFSRLSKGKVGWLRARSLERHLGLDKGSLGGLGDSFRLTEVTGLFRRNPRSPLKGNALFLGPGQGLPNGAPELVVDSIPTSPWPP